MKWNVILIPIMVLMVIGVVPGHAIAERWWMLGSSSDRAYQYFSNWTYTGTNFSVTSQETVPQGFHFDETYWWVVGETGFVYQYYDNWTYTGTSYNLSSEDNDPEDIHFDGTNWWVSGNQNNRIYQYYDNWTYTGTNYNVGTEDLYPASIYFDGTNWWMLGSTNDKAYQYFSNWTYTGTSYDIGNGETTPQGFHFNDTNWWATGVINDTAFQYFSNWTYTGTSYDLSSEDTNPREIFFIKNYVPNVTSVTAIPSSPFSNDTLIGNATCTDTNTLDTITAYWNWYRNGVSFSNNSATIIGGTNTNLANTSSTDTSVDDTWIFGVVCGDDISNSTETNSSTLTIQNSTPTINNLQLNVTDLGGSPDLWLIVNASDNDNNLDSCVYSSFNAAFSGSLCSLNISDTLAQAGTITVNDTGGLNVNFTFNFTLANNSVSANNSYTHNLTYQRIFRNDSLRNNETANALLYYITHLAPSGGSLVFGSPFGILSLAVSTTITLLSDYSGDWITGEVTGLEQQIQNTSATSNLSIQYILNQTHLNATNSQSFTFNSVNLSPTCSNVVSVNVATGTTQLTANCTYQVQSTDHLTETFGTEVQNTGETTASSGQAYTQIQLNATSTSPINLTSVNIGTRCRSGWTQNSTTVDVPITNLSNSLIYCNNTNIITRSRADYNITVGGTVVVDENVTGYMQILANNTDTLVTYTSAQVNSSPHLPSGWTNTSAEIYTVTLSANATNYQNRTIQTTSPLLMERDVVGGDCTGMTVFTDYCTSTSSVDNGDGTQTHTYTHRSIVNGTDPIFGDRNIQYNIPVARFTNWASRVASSEAVTRNSSSTNLTITSNTSYVIVTVGTNHSTSSLPTGDNRFEVTWQFTSTTTSPSPGGGGGGEQTIAYIPLAGAPDFIIAPGSAEVLVQSGQVDEWDYILTNKGNQTIKVKMTIIPFGTDPSWKWGTFKIGNFALTENIYTLAGGGSESIKVSVTPPVDVANARYRFNIRGSIVEPTSGVQHDAIFFTIVGEDIFAPITATSGDILSRIGEILSMQIAFPKAVGGVTGIPLWSIVGSIGIIGFVATRVSNGKKRRY